LPNAEFFSAFNITNQNNPNLQQSEIEHPKSEIERPKSEIKRTVRKALLAIPDYRFLRISRSQFKGFFEVAAAVVIILGGFCNAPVIPRIGVIRV
jgi:hypothetical protein